MIFMFLLFDLISYPRLTRALVSGILHVKPAWINANPELNLVFIHLLKGFFAF